MATCTQKASFASLVGLAEVLFAILIAWAFLGEAITATQALGGAVVLLGLTLARLGDRADTVLEAGWPDVPPAQPHAEPAIGSN